MFVFRLFLCLFLFSGMLYAQTATQVVNELSTFLTTPSTNGNIKQVNFLVSVAEEGVIKTVGGSIGKQSNGAFNNSGNGTLKGVKFTNFTTNATNTAQNANVSLKVNGTSLGTIELVNVFGSGGTSESITIDANFSVLVTDATVPKKYILYGPVKGGKVVTIVLNPIEVQIN